MTETERRLLFVMHSTLSVAEGFFALAAVIFLMASLAGDQPMLVEQYGRATEMRAEVWAIALLVTHGGAAVMLWNGFCKLGACFAAASVPIYAALAVFALAASTGDVIVIFSALVNGPLHVLIPVAVWRASGVFDV